MKTWHRFTAAVALMIMSAALIEFHWFRSAVMLGYYAGIIIAPVRSKAKWAL